MRQTPQNDSRLEVNEGADHSAKQPDAALHSLEGLLEIPIQIISWDELNFLHVNELALRHVPTRDRAEREMKNGVSYGDAVSLARPQNQLLGETDLHPIYTTLIKYSKAIDWMPEDLRIVARLNFTCAVKAFFETSVKIDLHEHFEPQSSLADTVGYLETKGSHFIVGRFNGADDPYDVNEGYCFLGKCGKQTVPSASLRGVLNLEGLRNHLSSMGGIAFDGPIERQCSEMIAEYAAQHLWLKFVEMIRTLRDESLNSARER